MAEELIEQVETDQVDDTQEVDTYQADYDAAWEEEETDNDSQNDFQEEENEIEDNEEVEQPNDEAEPTDELEDVESEEDSAEEKTEEDGDIFATLKWRKKDMPVTKDELFALAQKGFDAQYKWNEIAEMRPHYDIIKESGLTTEQVQMLADVVKGKSSEALALLAEQNGIDMLYAETNQYKPNVQQKNYELDDVMSEINSNADVAQQMSDDIALLPQNVVSMFSQKPDVLRALGVDYQNGTAQQVMPHVMKAMMIDPSADFVKTYVELGSKVVKPTEPKEEPKAKVAPVDNNQKKKLAVQKNTRTPKKKDYTNDYDAVWEDDDYFNKVKARVKGY